MQDLSTDSIRSVLVRKVKGGSSASISDVLAVEEPLEIRISYGSGAERVQKSISVTMRTPGNDSELALGFLFTEGIFQSYKQIKEISHAGMEGSLQKEHIVRVAFTENFVPQLHQSDRNFYTTSSCGVCGKSSIQSIRTVSPFQNEKRPQLDLSKDILFGLKGKLARDQSGFTATGGIHASGLFTPLGELVISCPLHI